MQIGLMIRDLGTYQDLARGLTQRGHQVETFLKARPRRPAIIWI